MTKETKKKSFSRENCHFCTRVFQYKQMLIRHRQSIECVTVSIDASLRYTIIHLCFCIHASINSNVYYCQLKQIVSIEICLVVQGFPTYLHCHLIDVVCIYPFKNRKHFENILKVQFICPYVQNN